MDEPTNPRTIDFDDWAAPALSDGCDRWLLRRLAIEANRVGKNSKPVSA